MLLTLDPRVQRLRVIVVEHRHRRLCNDRPAVEVGVDEVDRDAGQLRAVRQRLSRCIEPRKRGQIGRASCRERV